MGRFELAFRFKMNLNLINYKIIKMLEKIKCSHSSYCGCYSIGELFDKLNKLSKEFTNINNSNSDFDLYYKDRYVMNINSDTHKIDGEKVNGLFTKGFAKAVKRMEQIDMYLKVMESKSSDLELSKKISEEVFTQLKDIKEIILDSKSYSN